MFDYIVVGAGLAGSVFAERIANVLNKKVLIIEKRNHIGGNCYDYIDENGILVHKYGPHIFHTESKEVWDYLSNFTDWHYYEHEVLGFIDGKKVPIPFNLNSLHQLFSNDLANHLEDKLIKKFGYDVKIPILELKRVKDNELSHLAKFIYEKVFFNYTKKQWGFSPEELDPSVTGRVPVFLSTDNRYFQDIYQAMPKEGYNKLFESMLSSPNIKIMIDTDFKDVIEIGENKIYFQGQKFNGKLIYTGKIDEFFDYKFGELPYRSLRFDFETLNQEFFQEAGTINYPNDYDFTRITEFKHLTGQINPKTTIVREYPQNYLKGKNIPYYPIPKSDNLRLYSKYLKEANDLNVLFIGRLAEYRYYAMTDVISEALKQFKRMLNG